MLIGGESSTRSACRTNFSPTAFVLQAAAPASGQPSLVSQSLGQYLFRSTAMATTHSRAALTGMQASRWRETRSCASALMVVVAQAHPERQLTRREPMPS